LPGRAAIFGFRLVCWSIVAALLFGLLSQTLGPTDPKILAALLVGLLPAAFLAAYGHEVAGRIKKLGPFELFEIQKGAQYLEDISLGFETPDLAPDSGGAVRLKKFSERQQFFFDRAERYLTYLEFSGSEPDKGLHQEEYFKLLFTFARTALANGGWTKAIYWFERLERLSHRSVSPLRVDNYIAMSCYYSALETQDSGNKRDLWLNSQVRLSRLAREQALDYLGYFYLAYVQDELDLWYEAVNSNQAALDRRPRFAAAKYNAAVSHAKLGQYRQAYKMLERIESGDDLAEKILESARQDEELWKALKDPYWERMVRHLVESKLRRLP
jgi:tetratricopeptide (TPR) repeat protein